MFMVLLNLSGNKERAAEYMAGHRTWLQKGFDDGVFLTSGNLVAQPGGGILIHGLSEEEVQARLSQDPFVAHEIVTVQILEITPTKTDPRMAFLLENVRQDT